MKTGIDYFPLDVRLDTKFDLIEAEFGLTGFAVVVKLFQKIYGEQGYYCEWTKEVALLFSRQCGLGGNAVSEIVEAAIKRGIFDKTLYEKYQILTSRGIQERYFEIVSRRKNVKVKKEYLLVDCCKFLKNADISGGNVNIFNENADIFKQSKVKESKVKESKGEDIAALPPSEFSFTECMELYKRHAPTLYKKELESGIDTTLKNARAFNLVIDEGFTKEEAGRLFKAAEQAKWLTEKAEHVTLAWVLKHRQEIIAGYYDKIYEQSKKSANEGILSRNYSREEFNAIYTNPEDYEV